MARTRRRARRNIHSRCRYGGDATVAGAAPPERSRLATAWARWKAGACWVIRCVFSKDKNGKTMETPWQTMEKLW